MNNKRNYLSQGDPLNDLAGFNLRSTDHHILTSHAAHHNFSNQFDFVHCYVANLEVVFQEQSY